jgi:hypothetical protein
MKLIDRNSLIRLLSAATAQTFISVVSVTEPDMKAKNAEGDPNPYRIGKGKAAVFTISKVSKANGTANGDYEQQVINRAKQSIISDRLNAGLPPLPQAELSRIAAATPDFGTSWHAPFINENGERSALSINKKNPNNGEFYVRFVFRSKGTAEFIDNANGATEPSENVYPFLSESSDYSNQNLPEGEQVRFVVYNVRSIVEIAIGGERYRIIDNFADMAEGTRNKVWDIAEQYLEGQRKMQTV